MCVWQRCFSAAIVGLTVSAHALAQGPILPSLGESPAADVLGTPGHPLAPVGTSGQLVPADDAEIYNRGPLHEAFATPSPSDPLTPPVVVRQPPEPIDELPPTEAPEGANVTWISGYWAYDESLDDFLWVSGLWRDIPPGRVWVPGYWTEAAGGWQWISGVWMSDEQAQVTYVPSPPLSQERGPNIEPPGENFFWIPGHWSYAATNYQWSPGYWAPHQSQWIWVPAKYVWTPAGCIFVAGYWDYVVPDRGLCYAPVYFHHHHLPVRYTPSVCLDSWNLLTLHLFVRPIYGNYCFGDYYGPRYANFGYVPFYDFHQRRGYDPLFVHLRYQYGPQYTGQLRNWHQYFVANAQFRPQPTFRQQRELLALHADNPVVRASSIALMSDRLADTNAPIRLARLTDQHRQQQEEQARQLRAFTNERLRVELDHSRTPGRNENPIPGIPRGQGRGLQLSDAVRIERSIAGRAEAKIRPPESPDRL
ncbi:MAG: hypothetical protein ACK5Q5_22625, partial [Planctomycetaceae bacterium]